jgi:hypothetical protein
LSLSHIAGVAAQDKPASNLLLIAVSDNGRIIFDGLVEDLKTQGDPGIQPDIKYTTPLGALRKFCQGIGADGSDVALTTRHLHAAIAPECAKNGVNDFPMVWPADRWCWLCAAAAFN